MAEEVISARIVFEGGNIGGSGGDGSGGGMSEEGKELIRVQKENLGETRRTTKLLQTGLLGGAAVEGGALKGIIGKIGATVTGALMGAMGVNAIINLTSGGERPRTGFRDKEDPSNTGNFFLPFQGQNGETQVAEIDQKTGEIVGILTEQEAKQQGILDATGDITNKYNEQLQWAIRTGIITAATITTLELLSESEIENLRLSKTENKLRIKINQKLQDRLDENDPDGASDRERRRRNAQAKADNRPLQGPNLPNGSFTSGNNDIISALISGATTAAFGNVGSAAISIVGYASDQLVQWWQSTGFQLAGSFNPFEVENGGPQ